MTLSIQGTPTADAGSDASICQGSTYTMLGAATNQNSVTWSTAGDGSFTNGNTLGAIYTPGSTDISNGSVVLTLTAEATSPCAVDATDDMTLSIQGTPTADAGSDASICQGSTYTMLGAATNQNSVTWSTAGDGSFTNGNTLGAIYTPGSTDISNGSVVLTLTAEATSPCAVDATDDMTLSIQGTPTADAGSDASICQGSTYTMLGAATNQNSVTWSTAGDGSFTNGNTLGAIYTPGSTDISNGSVVLTLTAEATSPCAVDATDDMTLSIQGTPTADAGSDASICQGSTYTMLGAATNQNSVTWSTAGDGSFTNGNTLGAIYTPGSTDISNGSVVLTLTAEATSPCAVDATDDMTLSIQGTPTADAGSDASICQGSTYTMLGAATNQNSVTWSTAGDGSFTNGNTLGAIYTPGSTDISNGSVVLTLTAEATSPCAVDATDDMTLSIQGTPTADAGSDASICQGSTYTMLGAATNQNSVTWSTAGDGSFTNGNTLGAIYTPGSTDISNGSVVLTLTAEATSPCAVDATDDMTLSIQGTPTADAGSNADICETATYTMLGAATNQNSVTWSTAGDGSFTNGNTLGAIYTPGSTDISNGSVVLTLTAEATSPCAVDATDDMTLSIYGQPTSDAGSDGSICENGTYSLSGSVTNAPTVLWTSSGNGTFDDDASPTTGYTPGTDDITAGSATLTLTAYAVAPCGVDASDNMTLTVQELPTVSAGGDDNICEGSTYTMDGSASNQASVSWGSAGDGSFTNGTSINAVYTPGPTDISNGSVVLTLTAVATSPCAVDATDDMTLTIQATPTADAGPDAIVASGSTYTLDGGATHQSSVTWSTAGDGTFDDTGLLDAIYTPGTDDIDFGSVVLTLTSDATTPCTGTVADDMTLSFSYLSSSNLSLGWNIMSFYVQPNDIDMQSVVQPLIDNSTLIKVQDENGDYVQFLPGPGWSNTIGDMANTEGYYIKVNANTNLDATGIYVIFPFNVDLSTGWNMAGYPVKQSADAMTLLNDLITNNSLIKVMDEAGNFIQNIPPYGWLNTIVNFNPGEGYYIKTSADDVLTYAQPTKGSLPGIVPEIPVTDHFFSSGANPFTPMNIVIQNIIGDGFVVEEGDEIAVYDGDLEVGSAVIHNEYNGLQVIIAAGDDPASEAIDGFTPGNTITFKYWDKSYGIVYENIQAYHYFGDKSFAGLGTYAGDLKISALGVSENNQSDLAFLGQNYPNPFTNNTTINYGIYQDGSVLLSIFDVSGRRIQILEDAYRTRGRYSVTLNNASLEPGVYYYQLEVSGNGILFSQTKKMIVQ